MGTDRIRLGGVGTLASTSFFSISSLYLLEKC